MFNSFLDPALYQRSGIVLVETLSGALISRVASAMPADRIDWTKKTLESLRPDQRWVSQEPSAVIEDLRVLARGPAPYIGRVVEGLDVVLAKWAREDVVRFWAEFASLAKQPPHAVLAVIPGSAAFLHPSAEVLGVFEKQGRILRLGEK